MSNNYGIISHDTLVNIANAIREKANSNRTYYPDSMALAISQIRAGEGYIYPTAYALREFYGNAYDNRFIDRTNITAFEMRNNVEQIYNTYEVIGNVKYGNLYNKKIEFFKASYQNSDIVYGLKCQANEPANEISLINMDDLFYGCDNIVNAVSGPFTVSMINTYYSCDNLVHAACGPNVRYLDNCYQSCYNLENGISGDNVITMRGAYQGCSNLKNLTIGPNTLDITNIAYYCYALKNVTGGNNVVWADYAFYGCYYLDFIPLYFNHLKSGDWMFYGCQSISDTHMTDVSDNLENAIHMYDNCRSLVAATIPDNIINATDMFYNCISLNSVSGGDNVQYAGGIFSNCNSLETFDGLYNAIDLASAFSNCHNLTNVIVSENAVNVAYIFSCCYNLLEAIPCYEANNMAYAYANCVNLQNYFISPKAKDISNCFANCYNLTGNIIIPQAVEIMAGAFNGCNNIGDIVIHSNNLLNTGWRQVNAFRRTVYDTARHIVLTNLNSFNAFVYCNGAGNFTKTNETYAEPIELNIENNSYNVVRCSYNIQYNCYIYCTE